MKEATEAGRINAKARGIYSKFVEYTKDIRNVTNPQMRRFLKEDLAALHSEACSILQSPDLRKHLDGSTEVMLKIVGSRPVSEWLVWAKHTAKKD